MGYLSGGTLTYAWLPVVGQNTWLASTQLYSSQWVSAGVSNSLSNAVSANYLITSAGNIAAGEYWEYETVGAVICIKPKAVT